MIPLAGRRVPVFVAAALAAAALVRAQAQAPAFEVLVSEPRTVHSAPAGTGTCLMRLGNGTLVNRYHEPTTGAYALLSTDGGKIWARAAWPGDSDCLAVLGDGSVLAMGYMKDVRKTGPGAFLYPRWISRDHWKSWEGPLDTPISIPKGAPGLADDLKTSFAGPLFWKSLLELQDGRLVATMYGYFEGDQVPISGFKRVEGFNKTRTLLVESRDRGASWSLVATIAYDPQIGQEGFCEPALAQLPGGELVCIMRTGYTHDPMYVSHSRDGGRTWTKPVSTGLTGVDPRLLVLRDGLLACAYGVKEYDGNRRERRLMFSRDGGRTWFANTIVYAGYGGSYPDAIEIEPGKLLYGWDADGFRDAGDTSRARNFLRLATVTLRPVDPKRGLIPLPIAR
jgi:hypothetical protein